jgi:acetoin utilization deacetylase AcuC-like enzyme
MLAAMKAFYCDHFVLPLPNGHRFPMPKYAALRERVAEHPGIRLHVPPGATDAQLGRVHSARYLSAVVSGSLAPAEVRRIGFPWSPELVERSRRSVGGTIAAARVALEEGWAVNLAGGTHHAYADHGEGFCVFNDVAVAVRDLQAHRRVARAAVVDLDVHQGNGTAALFAGDASVFTVSVHGAGNYPFRKERSDLDIDLPDGTEDGPFLDAVERGVDAALRSRPSLVFFVAGVDAYTGDALGRLAVTRDGMAERDRIVYDRCEEAGVPVATVMAGGYAPDVDTIAALHAATVLEASHRWARRQLAPAS